jgi:hypothetical protein
MHSQVKNAAVDNIPLDPLRRRNFQILIFVLYLTIDAIMQTEEIVSFWVIN